MTITIIVHFCRAFTVIALRLIAVSHYKITSLCHTD